MKIYASITVIGRDQSGVVARVTSLLFVQKANIEGLEEKVTRGQFGMTIQASWLANQCNVPSIRAGLANLARSLGMEIKIRFIEPSRRQRFAILVTRETHCFDAIMAAVNKGQLKADPVIVISNHADLEPLA
ncbi:MAG: formyl transferase, partial [Verrucomicrobiales bacterium]